MIARSLASSLLVLIALVLFPGSMSADEMEVSQNGRYLIDRDGKPFFWLGDTAWGLFQIPSRDDVRFYLKSRAEQGFSVIHAAAVHDNPFITPPLENRLGDKAFIDDDLTRPRITPGNDPNNAEQYDYWDHVEFVIDAAAQEELKILFFPIFNMRKDQGGYERINAENAYAYGKFLGERFGDKPNLIWSMGGDVLTKTDEERELWGQLAKGITEAVAGKEDYSRTLMTYHTRGGNSSRDHFTNAAWLDFDMFQTWDSYQRICSAMRRDYAKTPTRPVLHGEGAYEEGPEYPTKPITPAVIRKQAYWATFSGGMHTYGNTNTWNFGSNKKYVTEDWKKAVHCEGAQQLRHFRDFWESVRWWEMSPDDSVIQPAKDFQAVAVSNRDASRVAVYFPEAKAVRLTMQDKGFKTAKGTWLDPRNGKRQEAVLVDTSQPQDISPPGGWEDAILILEAKT